MTGTTHDLPVKGIVFDMDGLLMDSETVAMRSLATAGDALGYDMPIDFCRKMIGVPADICRKLVFDTYGEDFPLEQYFQTHEEHLRQMVDNGELELKKGAAELLDYLDEQHIPYAIATSSSRYRADHHLELVGIQGRFVKVVTRDDVSKGKPDPEPYLTAAAALGVPQENVLALEDSYNGVRAAVAAELRVIMIPDILPPTEEMHSKALAVYDSLHQVIDYLQSVNQ